MNNELIKKARERAVNFPEFLIPSKSVDMKKWATIACDQYTSQHEYWKSVEAFVGDSPSTLHVTLPEIYLEDADVDERIKKANQKMIEYLETGVFEKLSPGVVYVEREILNGKVRKGLVLSVDLEKYNFSAGSRSLIRATEKTVIERIPPRIKIRNNAKIETPHILILIDDPKKTVVEKVESKKTQFRKIYDFDLMKNGGHIQGYYTNDESILSDMIDALNVLTEPTEYKKRYSLNEENNIMLFAMGDGNHSLATAKTHWENVKKNLTSEQIENHPARFALVEIMNLQDPALEFEPIHRVMFNTEPQKVLEAFVNALPGSYFKLFESREEYEKLTKTEQVKLHTIPVFTGGKYGVLYLNEPNEFLTVAVFEKIYNNISGQFAGSTVDYIHGEDSVIELASNPKNIGFYLPSMHKDELFKYVLTKGTLPKKTFSMGEADEKRFYLECREIR